MNPGAQFTRMRLPGEPTAVALDGSAVPVLFVLAGGDRSPRIRTRLLAAAREGP